MENSYFVYKWIEIKVLILDNILLMRPILSGFYLVYVEYDPIVHSNLLSRQTRNQQPISVH